MRSLILLILIFLSSDVFSCEEVSGEYVSVSETHWNYELRLNQEIVTLIYTDYWYTDADERVEVNQKYDGVCRKESGLYVLLFNGERHEFKYHPKLSHASYGAEVYSPGFTNTTLIKDTLVELWVK